MNATTLARSIVAIAVQPTARLLRNVGSSQTVTRLWLDAATQGDVDLKSGRLRVRTEPEAPACYHGQTRRGPDVPRRYGSWKSEVCTQCGAWRTMTHGARPEHVSAWTRASIWVICVEFAIEQDEP